jgi:hypothetical protein
MKPVQVLHVIPSLPVPLVRFDQAQLEDAAKDEAFLAHRKPALKELDAYLIEKKADGTLRRRSVGPVAFVPMKPGGR